MLTEPMDIHQELVGAHHRFSSRMVAGKLWLFDHLEAIAFKVDVEMNPGERMAVDVVVLFSNHCFTRGMLNGEVVAEDLVWLDVREKRVLDKQRYVLSRLFLPRLILELPTRHIQVADASRPNFVSFEMPPQMGFDEAARYAVFFEVERDKLRRRRVLLRVQSAYVMPQLTRRQTQADKIRFHTLIKRAYAK